MITTKYFADFADPDVINEGWCYVWAWMAWLNFPELRLAVYLNPPRLGTRGHALVVLPGRVVQYYDAGCTAGSPRLSHLGFFKGTPSWEPEHPRYRRLCMVPPEDFKKIWGSGERFDDQSIPRWTTKV